MWFAPDPSHEQRCKRLMAAAGRGDAAGITAELEGGLGDTAPLLAAAAWAAYRGSDAVLGALCGSPAGGQLLGRAPTSEEFYPYSEHLKFIAPLPFSPYTHLMHQSALVIAACRLHTNAVTLLLSRGARFPASAERDGSHMPLLAFWASQLPNLESPAASAAAATILELLLASSADPLAVPLLPGRTCLGVHPRHGTIASFLLVCRDPQLLGAAVQHVLRQRAEARGGRPLSHSEAAVLLVAARLAGLAAESQHLLAQQGSDVEAEEEQEGVLRLGSELQAQLMADAAAGGICDMLELFLSQGASPSRSVRWHRPVPNDEAGQGAQAVYTAMYAAVGDAERSPLALAAAGGHREAVALLLRHGAQLDLPSLRHAVWSFDLDGMEALLSLVPPQQLPASPFISFGEATIACPILLILPRHLELAAELAARAAAEALPPDCLRSRLEWAVCCMLQLPRPPFGILLESGMPHLPAVKQAYRALAPRLAELQAHALRLLDRVYAAGYRVRVYIDICGPGPDGVWRMGPRREGLQPEELHKLQALEGHNRLLWMAYSRPSWSAAEHRSYLPAFRAAVRTLLLAARFGLRHQGCRGASPCAGAVAAAALAVLPQELLHTIIGEAAYPLSAWLVA